MENLIKALEQYQEVISTFRVMNKAFDKITSDTLKATEKAVKDLKKLSK